ncbi:MAG: LLM class flavin-dependent oxidoreductase [Acidimicrobiales bacterium]
MPPVTRFGLRLPPFTGGGDGPFDRIAEIAAVAESSGFDSIWVADVSGRAPDVPVLDRRALEAYTLLGGLAARTDRARLGALVTGVTTRSPALLAKQVTALDVLSGGRAVLGMGAGRSGSGPDSGSVPLSLRERFDRLEEAVQICRAMFRQETTSFDGRFFRVKSATNRPGPICAGGPPILIGGGGEHRTLSLVARFADACNVVGDSATVSRKLKVLAGHCQKLGRDPGSVTKTGLVTLFIAPSASKARSRADKAAFGEGPATVVAGDPSMVVAQISVFLAAGLDGLVLDMPDAFDLDSVALAGRTLADAFGGLEPAR